MEGLIWLWACVSPKDEPAATETCESCDGACQADTFQTASAQHVSGEVDYGDDLPPTWGNHDACWAEWGVHTDEVADENWVHNLEHGGVVFLYDCTDCDADVASLDAWVTSLPPGTALATPYAEMDWAWAAVSWGHRLLLGCFDLDAMKAFYDANYGHAPESTTADPGAGCTDTGTTDSVGTTP